MSPTTSDNFFFHPLSLTLHQRRLKTNTDERTLNDAGRLVDLTQPWDLAETIHQVGCKPKDMDMIHELGHQSDLIQP